MSADYFGTTPLMQAVLEENRETVELLLSAGENINAQDNRGRTALMLAAQNGKIFSLNLLLQKNADVKIKDNEGYDALYYSLSSKHPEIIKALLAAGAAPSSKGKSGVTTYMQAVQNITGEILDILGAGSFLSEKDDDGRTPLMHAVSSGNLAAARWLLKHGVDVNARDKQNQNALFHIRGHEAQSIDAARDLIAADADIKRKNKTGDTPFVYWTNRTDFPDLLEVFLNAGAGINETGAYSRTALHAALDGGRPKQIIELLLDKGADTTLKDYYNEDALTKAANGRGYQNKSEQQQIIDLLKSKGAKTSRVSDEEFRDLCYRGTAQQILAELENGANPNYIDYQTPLFNVIMRNDDLETVKAFIKYGANVKQTDENGVTTLLEAAKYGNLEIIKHLLENGSSYDERDAKGQSAFLRAAMKENISGPSKIEPEVLELCLNAGADINERSAKEGKTALHFAVINKSPAALEFLLEKGADIDAPDYARYDTPLMLAVQDFTDLEVIEILLKNGARADIPNSLDRLPYPFVVQCHRDQIAELFKKYGITDETPDPAHVIRSILTTGNGNKVENLIKTGFDVNTLIDGVPAVIYTVQRNIFTEPAQILLKNGADKNAAYYKKSLKDYISARGDRFINDFKKYFN
ncbi:MAG: ankyrin repeat domain-containing protein [Elusimicrobia bacterium]|nr:ankyrin repeat domain-containing protein [Elusimicrobiota bacterium]